MVENVDIEIEVEDENGQPRSFKIVEFTYRRPLKTIVRGDPLDDQIGDPGGFDDVVCRWKDTNAYFTERDWECYVDTINDALNDYLERG
jgi:hypothetical protein